MSKVADRYRAPCAATSGCRQCGKPVGPRNAYCHHTCQEAFESEHFWGTARSRAITRWVEAGPRCARCGTPPPTNEKFFGGKARKEWWYQFREFKPEVNHIVPLNRKPCTTYHFGCFNHRTNLEVVCHRCHVQITKEQRAAGLIGRAKPQLPLSLGDAQSADARSAVGQSEPGKP